MKEVTYDEAALKRIQIGVNKLADAVGVTLGPGGANVILERLGGGQHSTKDGVTVAREIILEDPIENIGAMVIKEAANKTSQHGGDGPQPLYSNVLTSTGFVKMGDLKIGDEICGTNATIQRVLGIYPKGERKIYKFSFADGSIVECCEEHIWQVNTSYGAKKILTTKQLIQSNKVEWITKDNFKNHGFYVPKTIVQFNKNDDKLILDPYLVGVLLGDGSLSGTGSIELSIGYKKEFIINKLILPKGISVVSRVDAKKNYIRVRFEGTDKKGNALKEFIQQVGLLGVKSDTKFIPKEYLYSSLESREKLLSGLLDTDGCINNRGLFEFSTISNQLSYDFLELCKGLGKSVKKWVLTRKENSSYSMTPINRIQQLEGYKYGNKLLSIEDTNLYTEMQCIKVSNPDNLYITDDYVVTHNTTTSTILAQAIFNGGLKAVLKGSNRIDIKRGIDLATKMVVEELKKISQPISKGDIYRIAKISANGDDEIAKLIDESVGVVGNDGIVTVEDTKGIDSYTKKVEGLRWDRGYLSPYFVTNQEKMECEFRNCEILIYEGKIESIKELLPLLDKIRKRDQLSGISYPLLIIAEDIVGDALGTLALNHIQQRMSLCAVQNPDHGDSRKESLRDIAAVTGATIIAKETGISLKSATVDVLGKAEKIRVNQWTTTIIEGKGNEDDVFGRITTIKEQMKDANDYALVKLKERYARLTSGMVVVYVGGVSDIEIKEKKDRIDDALCATKAALEEGIIIGGGMAYIRALQRLDKLRVKNKGFIFWRLSSSLNDTEVGQEILFDSLLVPMNYIVDNATDGYSNKVFKHLLGMNEQMGFNAKTLQFENLIKSGVIDPCKVTRLALENASSVAGMLLSTKAVVSNVKPK